MNTRKRIIALFAVLAIVLAACGGGEGGDTTTTAAVDTTTTAGSQFPDLGGRVVTVGVENAYLPYNYIPLGGTEGEGWDYDAWAAICELLNCEPQFIEAGWPAVIDQVAQGDIDTAADGISITDDRKEKVDYSDSYMTVIQKFVVGLDDDRYATAQDLIDDPDAIVATQVGTTNYDLAVKLVGADRIKAYDQFGLAIQALIAEDVDAVIIDDTAGLGYIGQNAEVIKTIDDGLKSDPLGFIFPKGSDLVEPVNLAIAELRANGTMEELGRKFFGASFTLTYDDIEEVG